MIVADGFDFMRDLVDCDNRRLRNNNAPAASENECVRCAEVNCQITRKKTEY